MKGWENSLTPPEERQDPLAKAAPATKSNGANEPLYLSRAPLFPAPPHDKGV